MFKFDEIIKAVRGDCARKGGYSKPFSGISTDSRTIKPSDVFIPLVGNNFDGHDFILEAVKKGARCIIKQKGKADVLLGNAKGPLLKELRNVSFIEVPDTTFALGDLARFVRNKYDVPVIAVTGSNGKTTSKDMIACALEGSFEVLKNEGTKNNHIGVPSALLNACDKHKVIVMEIGTNHHGEIKYLVDICRPTIGIITNIGASHLEYFKDLSGVMREKYELINNLAFPGIGILNADDTFLYPRS